MKLRTGLIALAAVISIGCAGAYEPPAVPLSDGLLAEARDVLQEADARRDDVQLTEGGVYLDLTFYEWSQVDLDANRPPDILNPRQQMDGAVLDQRERSAPRRVLVTPRNLTGVRVQPLAFGAFVELDLDGEKGPGMLDAKTREEADRLAAAFDLLRRAGAAD
jgi:hypothetical protein